MAVYVDNERIEWKGKLWCHLVADSLDELHAFAKILKLKPSWFQECATFPHYDVTTIMRERALYAGAVASNKKMMLVVARKLKSQLSAAADVHCDVSDIRIATKLNLSLF